MAVRYSYSPARKDGQRRLTAIPVDIYMLIMDQLLQDDDMASVERKSILSNMNLVCRLFSALAAPKLFALVAFKGTQEGGSESRRRRRDSWLKQLLQGEETACLLGTFVRKLEYFDWMPPESEHEHEPVLIRPDLPRHIQVIPRFPNLKTLDLTRTPISRDFFEAVLALDKLETLCISHCSFRAPNVPVVAASSASLPRLTKLDVTSVDEVAPYVSALASLAATPSLRSLRTTERGIARGFMVKAGDIPLERLEVPFVPQDVAILSAFLDRTPALSELSVVGPIDSITSDDVQMVRPALALRDTALPSLQFLRCPLYLLGSVLKNPSISRLSLVDPCDWLVPGVHVNERQLLPLKQCPLRELEIPAWFLSSVPVEAYAPKLVKLAICYPIDAFSMPLEWIVTELCTRRHKLSLQTLELHFFDTLWKLDLRLQHQMVAQHLSRAFPTVRRFALIECVHWERVADSSEWTPVIHERESVKALLQLEQEALWQVIRVADFGGALAALFVKGEMTAAIAKRLSQGSR